MGYDRGDGFTLDFELNGIPFGSKSKGKLSPRSYPIQFDRKGNTRFPSVETAEVRSQRCHYSEAFRAQSSPTPTHSL